MESEIMEESMASWTYPALPHLLSVVVLRSTCSPATMLHNSKAVLTANSRNMATLSRLLAILLLHRRSPPPVARTRPPFLSFACLRIRVTQFHRRQAETFESLSQRLQHG